VSNQAPRRTLACFALSLLISCGAPKDPASAPTTPAQSASVAPTASATSSASASAPAPVLSPAAPAGHLALGPLKLTNERGNGLVLAEDGAVSKVPGGEPVGTLRSDGQFVLTSGRLGPKLELDGHVVMANGQRFPVRIAEDGAVEAANAEPVRFDESGRLVGGNPDAPKTEVTGLTPALRKTAAFLLILAAFPIRQ
jgi:hypothetical protein